MLELYRDTRNAQFGGVCAGLSQIYNIDVSLLRILFLATLFFGGTGAVIYMLAWMVIPQKRSFARITKRRKAPTDTSS